MKKSIIFIILPFVLLHIFGCSDKSPSMYVISGETQGTYYKITYYAHEMKVSREEIEKKLNDFLQTASLWEENSIISRVNRNEPVPLNEEFIDIFNNAQNISRMTEGAFDITVGDLVACWGFGFKQEQEPSRRVIDSLLKYVGYQNIDIIDNEVVKVFPETRIDFNAIAKGYSVDMIAERLASGGNVRNFVVDIGGEVRASGTKPDGSKWNIGIEEPSVNADSERKLQSVIALTGKSVATSGSYRKYREKDGVRYSHTIDPKTGYPVSHTLLSATVIADKCMTADALATAFMVMGKEKSMKFLEKNPQYEGYFIYSDENGMPQVSYTSGFEDLFL